MDAEQQRSKRPAKLATLEYFEDRCATASPSIVGNVAAVLTIGIDGIKTLHATFSRAFGEEVLELCCERLFSALREGDYLVHLPGVEFGVLVLSLPDREASRILANRLRNLLQRPFIVHGNIVGVVATVGIALSSDAETQPHEMLKHSGIETQEELAFVRADGCDSLQGYLLGRPLLAEKLADVLRSFEQKPVVALAAR